ncbi:amidohydrolase family protein [Blastococcus sp. SYSU D00820]
MRAPVNGGTDRVVDVHAHVQVPAVDELVRDRPELAADLQAQLRTFGPVSMELNRELALGSYRPYLLETERRLAQMDTSGVDVQAVSVTPVQYHYWAPRGLAEEIVAAVNEHIAGLAAARPDRLTGLATVSLQDPELAADQLRTAVGTLGLRGMAISTSAAGRDFSDRSFDPLWAAAEETGAFVFVHPWGCSLEGRLTEFYLGNVIGQPLETTLALSHMVFGGVFDRFPGLRVCGAHGGGYFPVYLGRADHAYEVRPESRTMQRRPSEYLGSLYFDSLVYRPDGLQHLVDVAGAGHVLIGTDYPFDMGVTDPVTRLDRLALPPEDRAAIAGGTAAALLRLS